jgi:membrane fusion protein (multidrug efflux system)
VLPKSGRLRLSTQTSSSVESRRLSGLASLRVTAYLQQRRSFVEGAGVRKNTALYRLEQGPFQADLAAKTAAVARLQAMLENANLTTDRARALLGGPAGQQSIYDAAIASQRSIEAQVEAAQANVAIAQINLDYTDIKSPIDGKIGRTSVTEGNVVGLIPVCSPRL